jgi:hypothetical protein
MHRIDLAIAVYGGMDLKKRFLNMKLADNAFKEGSRKRINAVSKIVAFLCLLKTLHNSNNSAR